MNNPYTPATEVVVASKSKSRIAIDMGLLVFLVLTWLVVTYAVSLPKSYLLTKDASLIAISPFIPIYFLVAAIVGATSLATIIAFSVLPLMISVVGSAIGIRKKRTWVGVIAIGVSYGLFLRVFYLLCNIA